MATVLSDIVCNAQLLATLTKTEEGLPISVKANQGIFTMSLTAGTTANKADRFFVDTDRVLAEDADDALDLYDLAGFDRATDLVGNAVTFAEIVGLMVRNKSTSAGTLVLGGEGSAAAWNSLFSASDTYTMDIKPGGFVLVAAPGDPAYAVADTSNHLLNVNASGGGITYDIVIIGRSA